MSPRLKGAILPGPGTQETVTPAVAEHGRFYDVVPPYPGTQGSVILWQSTGGPRTKRAVPRIKSGTRIGTGVGTLDVN